MKWHSKLFVSFLAPSMGDMIQSDNGNLTLDDLTIGHEMVLVT